MSAGSEYQKAKVRRQCEYIRTLKEGSPCADCGVSYPYYIMTFDHRPELGPKLFTFGHLQRRWVNADKLAAEICDLVCANCQAARTYRRSQGHTVLSSFTQ